jgi:ABC-type Mn2+/Zn2+ transport system permease subunit
MLSDLITFWELLKEGIFASLIIGAVLPIVGCLLALRRSALLGIAVPQFSAAGLAFGLFLLPLFPAYMQFFLDEGHPPMAYSFAFAFFSAIFALVFLAYFSARIQVMKHAFVASSFAFSLALTILLLDFSALGTQLTETLLRGEIIFLDYHGVFILLVVNAVVLVGLLLNYRLLLFTSFDPEMSFALGHSPKKSEFLQLLIVGAAVGVGVITVGPILVFALLFLPPLIARYKVVGLRSYLMKSVSIGILSVLCSWPVSFYLDFPYGPSVALVSVLLGFCVVVFRAVSRLRV